MIDKNVCIRKAKASDIEKIIGFQLTTALETEGLQLEKTVVTNGVKAVFKDPTKGQYYIAEKSGKPVGCLLVVPEWSDWRNGTVLWIHSVYIDSNERRQGILRMLYEHLRNLVKESPHLMGIRTLVDKRNQRGIRVAQALGLRGDHYETFEWLKEKN